jgi:RNA polymerase sigma-70 factor (ECF subfamily)
MERTEKHVVQENSQGAGGVVGAYAPDAAAPSSAFEAAIAGDGAALHRVWQENRRWVAAILLAHKPRWADVEDLLQEVALSLVRKVGEVRDPRALKPWLRTVAMNAAHAAARSGRKRSKDLGLEGDIEQPFMRRDGAAADHVTEREEGRRLLELAAQLPDGYREPLLLKAVQNLSYREIGEILGLPETTVETRIARGRKQLRELALQQAAR